MAKAGEGPQEPRLEGWVGPDFSSSPSDFVLLHVYILLGQSPFAPQTLPDGWNLLR